MKFETINSHKNVSWDYYEVEAESIALNVLFIIANITLLRPYIITKLIKKLLLNIKKKYSTYISNLKMQS